MYSVQTTGEASAGNPRCFHRTLHYFAAVGLRRRRHPCVEALAVHYTMVGKCSLVLCIVNPIPLYELYLVPRLHYKQGLLN